MKLFLDTANTSDWEDLIPTRLFHGITTNPILAGKSGLYYPTINWGEMARRAADLGALELHAQVYGPEERYVDWAETFYELGNSAGLRPVVKIPLTEGAIRNIGEIKKLNGAILLTAAFDTKQMLIATSLKVDYIAPYFGRMLDKDMAANEVLKHMLAIRNQSLNNTTEILVASLRTAEQIVTLATQGHNCFTIAPKVAIELLHDENTISAVKEFEAAIRRY